MELGRSRRLQENNDDSFRTESKVLLAINIILIIYTIISGIAITVLLIRRRDFQPLKKRCSKLIFLSFLGNYMFALILLVQESSIQYCYLHETGTTC